MNERIKELALQAFESTTDPSFVYEADMFVNIFANLIVRECIAMADDFELEVNQRGLVDRIKQHFGVKE